MKKVQKLLTVAKKLARMRSSGITRSEIPKATQEVAFSFSSGSLSLNTAQCQPETDPTPIAVVSLPGSETGFALAERSGRFYNGTMRTNIVLKIILAGWCFGFLSLTLILGALTWAFLKGTKQWQPAQLIRSVRKHLATEIRIPKLSRTA